MTSSDPNKKYKRPKQNTLSTTKPDISTPTIHKTGNQNSSAPLCPLLAKDSEWVDILQAPSNDGAMTSSTVVAEEEAILQLVECEDGPQMKPLAIMFPDLLEKDPQTLEGVLNKAMSTTEVTKHLVDLGQKANFTFMKKSSRLIPKDKQWLESVTENNNSHCSLASGPGLYSRSLSSAYDADQEADNTEIPNQCKLKINRKKKKKPIPNFVNGSENCSSQGTLNGNEDNYA